MDDLDEIAKIVKAESETLELAAMLTCLSKDIKDSLDKTDIKYSPNRWVDVDEVFFDVNEKIEIRLHRDHSTVTDWQQSSLAPEIEFRYEDPNFPQSLVDHVCKSIK